MKKLINILGVALFSILLISASAIAQDKKEVKVTKEVKKECCSSQSASVKSCCDKAKCETAKAECKDDSHAHNKEAKVKSDVDKKAIEHAKKECCASKAEVKKEKTEKK